MDKMKNRILIVVLIAASVILIGLAGLYAVRSMTSQGYTASIKMGTLYLESGEYNKAIIAFKNAIDEDDTQVEAYEGLAEAYMLGGYRFLALDTIRNGMNVESSEKLVTLDEQIKGVIGTAKTDGSRTTESKIEKNKTEEHGADGSKTDDVDTEPVLNESLLSFIASATYADYKTRYGIDGKSVDGTTYAYTVKALNLELFYDNNGAVNRIKESSGEPFDSEAPDRIFMKNISYLFDTSGRVPYTKLSVLNYVKNLRESNGNVTFEACGCEITLQVDEDGYIASDAHNTIKILKPLPDEDHVKVLTGKVLDASTGQGVADVTVRVYEGYGAYGSAEEATTDSSGDYSVNVPEGDCYVEVEKSGYITEGFSIYILSNAETTNMDIPISKELSDDVIKIVLTWDSSPRDLDSYLIGTSSSGKFIKTWFSNQKGYDFSGNIVAELDLDDTDGYGPETTTLSDINGTYNFMVADYHWTGTMATSGAVVKVYRGDSLVETIEIPSDVVNVWNVLNIDQGNIIVNNCNSNLTASPAYK